MNYPLGWTRYRSKNRDPECAHSRNEAEQTIKSMADDDAQGNTPLTSDDLGREGSWRISRELADLWQGREIE